MDHIPTKKTFIQLLDEYQNGKDFQYSNLTTILQLSKYDYLVNHFNYLQYCGLSTKSLNTASYCPTIFTSLQSESTLLDVSKNPIVFIKDPYIKDPYIKDPYIKDQFTKDQFTKDQFFTKDQYDIYTNALYHMKNVPLPPPPTPILYKVVIDSSINHFSDLIHILKTNEYRTDTEYNIDLKALVQVKEELIQLNEMVGMASLKDSILDQLLYFIQYLHLGKDPDFMHTILCGPPGTGKTEVAILLGKIYAKLGILKNGTFKKATRSDLVAGYLGQTAIKTNKLVQECLGGCLFIDEAYSLGNSGDSDSYSKECLDTLCEALSNHKADLMVIIAGYEEDLYNTFFRVNRGLESRFIWRFNITVYSSKELMYIFQKKVQDNGWKIDLDLVKWFDQRMPQFKHYGRDMELLFSYTKIAHGRRIYGKSPELRKQITIEDLDAGYATFIANSSKKTSTVPYGLYV